jgi:sugar O-acyltransferase (sialic acid O-acetyltransferase NeuD family)
VDVIIWGAKGHAKVLAELFALTSRRVIALFDNDKRAQSPLTGVPLAIGWAGFCTWMKEHMGSELAFAIAIGGDRGHDRIQIAARLVEAGLSPAELIHPSAYVSPTARLATGCQALARCTVGIDVQLAEQCIVNTGAVIDHECELERGVHIGPGAALAGCVAVGECTFIGTNATVLPRIRIGRHATVGAGAVVTKDVPDYSIAYGVPARVRNKKTPVATI